MAEPEIGILSQTLTSSPTVRWILPARIRSSSRNDVVFVGDTTIHLREFLGHGQLTDSIAKLDFRCQILGARIISAKVEVKSTLDAILDQSGEEERYIIDGHAIADDLPPQILVLITASNALIYVYATNDGNEASKFIFGRRPLMGSIWLPDRYGQHVAVDPESRALAITASAGHCSIFSLKPVDDIKCEIDKWRPSELNSFKPTLEQRVVQVDGFILRMDFLRSASNQPTKVILVLLVSNEGETRLLLYQWDTRLPLMRIKPMRCSGQSLAPQDSFPLMLIPSSMTTSFILITETELVLFDNVSSAEAKRISFDLPDLNDGKRAKKSAAPLWTQWAKPRRHINWKDSHDDLFLVREDGILLTYLISYKSSTRVEALFSPGTLGISVDTAFCILAGPRHKGGDIIIAGGNMTDGGVFHVAARGSPERTQILGNASPVQDMILLATHLKGNSRTPELSSDRVFVSYGNGPSNGAVAEILTGLESQVGWTVELDDADSIQKLWTLEIERNKTLWLLASHPLYTSLFVFDLTKQEAPESADYNTCPGFDFDSSTIAIALIWHGLIVQVTSHAVNFVPLAAECTPVSIPFGGLECICATIQDADGTFIIAHTNPTGFGVTMFSVNADSNGESDPTIANVSMSEPLPARPVSICSSRVGRTTVIVVGTDHGHLCLYAVQPGIGLTHLLHRQLQDLDLQSENVAISSLALITCPWAENGVLLCGLRNGLLVFLEAYTRVKDQKFELDLVYDAVHKIGSTTVALSAEDFSPNPSTASVLVLCESVIKRVTLMNNSAGADYQISNLWLTDRGTMSSIRPTMNAIHRVPQIKSTKDDERSGLILCATTSEILFSSLVDQPQSVVRRLPIPGIPKRLVYSKHLNHLVAAIEEGNVPRSSDKHQLTKLERPRLQFIAVDHMEFSNPHLDTEKSVPIGEPGEQIRALINWSPTDGSQHFETIVIALEEEQPSPTANNGRVVLLSAKAISKGKKKPMTIGRYPGKPVTALCEMGKSSLLIATVNTMILRHLDVETRKWSTLATYELPSLATSLSTRGSFIFITTLHHSLHILREHKGSLNFHASDSVARNTTNAVALDGSMSVVTEMWEEGTSFISFAEDRVTSGLHQVFRANMPLIIHRLRQSRHLQQFASSDRPSRHRLHAVTADGTLYYFSTLTPDEWKLLDFLEGISHLEARPDRKRPRAKEQILAEMVPQPERVNPSAMHIHGDVLQLMVEPGQFNLRNLFGRGVGGPVIKQEENEADSSNNLPARQQVNADSESAEKLRTLKALAAPLLGRRKDSDDIVGAVIIWLRKLLSYPGT